MGKYAVKNPFYLHEVVVYPGEEIELTDDEVEYFTPKDVLGKPVSDGDSNEPDLDDHQIKHVGGGMYELPNGEKIKGRELAQTALDALKVGEPDVKVETGDPANTGTGDPL